MTQALDVRIDDNAFGFLVRNTENDIGSFSAAAGELDELSHGSRDLTCMFFGDGLATIPNRLRLVVVEASGFDELLQLTGRGGGKIGGGSIFSEKGGRDLVDPLVGALGAEDGGHEKLQWIGMVEFAVDIRGRRCATRQ